MGIMNKIKGILFDEDEIEVPVDSDELPDRTPKEVKRTEKKMSGGFVEHHSDSEEENPIKEIIIPKEEANETKMTREVQEKSENHFNLVDDEEMERDFPTDGINFDNSDMSEDPFSFDFDSINETREQDDVELTRSSRSVDEVRREYNIGAPLKKHTEEIKDYRKMLSRETTSQEKKPFTVTPVISPVYGVLDKNYTADDVVEKRELINKTNSGVKPRTFGPVSYNDQPLPTVKKKDTSLKEDLVELNTTINELIKDSVSHRDVDIQDSSMKSDSRVEEKKEEESYDDDDIIQTENYDDYETNGIENEYIEQNNIEDAFESTEELHSIKERDEGIKGNKEEDDPVVNFDDIVEKPVETDDDVELDNTIETDLFNLIDSMYKSETSDEEEE